MTSGASGAEEKNFAPDRSDWLPRVETRSCSRTLRSSSDAVMVGHVTSLMLGDGRRDYMSTHQQDIEVSLTVMHLCSHFVSLDLGWHKACSKASIRTSGLAGFGMTIPP